MRAHRIRNAVIGSSAAKAGLPLLMALILGLGGCAANSPGPQSSEATGATPDKAVPADPMTDAQRKTFEQASAKADAGDYDAAAMLLQQLRQARPDLARVASRLGWVRQKQAARAEAEQSYREALTLDPADPMAANNLALMLQQDGQFDEARRLLTRAIKSHPESPALHLNLAILAELYLLDLPTALDHYRTYQDLTGASNPQVAGWIADLERRVN